MKKVTAFLGTYSKKHTWSAAQRFTELLQSLGDVDCEIVPLGDYELETCRGCKLCFEKGEEFCPLKDDRDALIEKMALSDGVVFASPNYAFHVSACMKIFLDRLAFFLHRPFFFGKAFTSIVAQGVYGGRQITRYLDFFAEGLGFNTVRGSCLTALEPITERERRKNDEALAAQGDRFYKRLLQPGFPSPSLFRLMAFRFARTSMRLELDETNRDYAYYKDKGWFESAYYYPTRLGFLKNVSGYLLDNAATRMARRRTK